MPATALTQVKGVVEAKIRGGARDGLTLGGKKAMVLFEVNIR